MEVWYYQLLITRSLNAVGANAEYKRIALDLPVNFVVLTAMSSTTKTRDILIQRSRLNSVFARFKFYSIDDVNKLQERNGHFSI
jgi:hypothetical protein